MIMTVEAGKLSAKELLISLNLEGRLELSREYEKGLKKIFEGEPTSNTSRFTLINNPNGPIPKLVRSVRAICILMVLSIVPFQFAFKHKTNFKDEDRITRDLIVIDVLYSINLILQASCIPYIDRFGNTVTHPRKIFHHFIR